LNRSIPTEKVSLESTVTLEKPLQDNQLSEQCVAGLNDLLATSARFQIKRCVGTLPSADPKSLSFGSVLDWHEVDSICAKYETQALLVLEYFDTDFSVLNPGATAGAAIGSVLNGNGSAVQVKGTATAIAGWRVYYPSTKSIVYEDTFRWKKTWTQSSTNPIEALGKLIKKNDALLDVSYVTGNKFAMSIVPLFYWENRAMYKGKKGMMERAERMALTKDWERALAMWSEIYETSGKTKIRAKAAYNAALSCEVLGKLEDAQQWIQKSYVEKGKNEALHYSDILDKRVREQAIIRQQQPE
jgi:hypothetical protein